MNIKTTVLCILCCFFAFTTVQGQKTIQELLMSTHWESQNFWDESESGYVKLAEKTRTYVENINGSKDSINYVYYLSDTPDTSFDETKVGKSINGEYIIENGGKYVFVTKIVELSPSKLVVVKMIPGFDSYGHKIVYFPVQP
ncbi:hypothetical protein [uncultured Bacteroides sp.]|uniref:hypothetical protein n=1 Tax=uncultured Bacteroides sp. TaxID=162156 RepID=UPI002608C4FF|nr:hypothetical protein [uncultured Bacteroides sp.]